MNKLEDIIKAIKGQEYSLSGYLYDQEDGSVDMEMDIEKVLVLLVEKLDEYKQRIEELEAIDPRGWMSSHGAHCGLEDRGITDRYEACNYGMELVFDHIEEMIGDKTV